MSFNIDLIPPTLSEAIHHRHDGKVLAILSRGLRPDAAGRFHTADGVAFSVEVGAVTPDALSPDLCARVFEAAARTDALIMTIGSTEPAMRVKGSHAPTPRGLGPVRSIATPTALCAALEQRRAEWRLFEQKLHDMGVIGANDDWVEPPADPGDETRVRVEDSEVAIRCAADEAAMAAKLGWTIKTVVVSRNPDWGVVWRADIAPRDHPASLLRATCWDGRPPHGEAVQRSSVQPLEMFDPKQTLAPLKGGGEARYASEGTGNAPARRGAREGR